MDSLIGALVMILGGAGVFLFPMFSYGFKNATKKRNLSEITDYKIIMQQCLALDSDMPDGTLLKGNDQRLPKYLRYLEARNVHVQKRSVQIEFAGGFDHFGYRFEQSYPDTNKWILYWYTESGKKELASLEK